MGDQKIQLIATIKKFFDRSRRPWSYVPEELPTESVKIFARRKNGTILDSSSGETNMGSIFFTGSVYGDGPGTFALRIIRRSVHVGSIVNYNTEAEWALHHSRLGTLDQIPFFQGTRANTRFQYPRTGFGESLGGPMNPVYILGPGTITARITPRRGTARFYSSMEGILSIDIK